MVYHIKGTMNTETYTTIPIFFKLYETYGKATDALVLRMQILAEECNVTDDLRLVHIQQRDENPSQSMLVYVINTRPSRQRHSAVIGAFLDKLFEQFYDKHVAYTEPLATSREASRSNAGGTK